MRFVSANRLDQAFQCVFRLGNEHTLLAVLRHLDSLSTWRGFPEVEARYLAHLLVSLLCKDPLGAAAREACVWVEALLRTHGPGLLAIEDLPKLRTALFSLSGAPGESGLRAAS